MVPFAVVMQRCDAQFSQRPDLMATVGDLCVAAEQQRLVALRILGRVIEATRLPKARTATRDPPLVAYTAKPDFYDGPMTPLFIDVLSKPSSPDAIVASVRRCVVQEATGRPERRLAPSFGAIDQDPSE
jgi:hypothetical protein